MAWDREVLLTKTFLRVHIWEHLVDSQLEGVVEHARQVLLE